MTTQPEPTPQEENASSERLREEQAMRAPDHDDPDAIREDVGLDDEGRLGREPRHPDDE